MAALEKERRLKTAARIHHCDTDRNVPTLCRRAYVQFAHTLNLILYHPAFHSTKLLSRYKENMSSGAQKVASSGNTADVYAGDAGIRSQVREKLFIGFT